MEKYNSFEKIANNLYKRDKKYFKLFAHSVTPNGCWLASPFMRELIDIEVDSGTEIFGNVVEFETCGTVPGCNQFIKV